MTTTKQCDGCHEKTKLYFFPVLMGGYMAYCQRCAEKYGYICIGNPE
jgi:hypothetical protein